jgi:hypothetical protein
MPQPNGNFLICEGLNGEFFEIDSTGMLLWKYINPVSASGIITQGNPPSANLVFKIKRYETNYSGFAGQTIVPGLPIEINPLNYTCTIYPLSVNEASKAGIHFSITPNPANEMLAINYNLKEKEGIEITITDARGRIVLRESPNVQYSVFNIKSLTSGIYFVEINNGYEKAVKKFLKE